MVVLTVNLKDSLKTLYQSLAKEYAFLEIDLKQLFKTCIKEVEELEIESDKVYHTIEFKIRYYLQLNIINQVKAYKVDLLNNIFVQIPKQNKNALEIINCFLNKLRSLYIEVDDYYFELFKWNNKEFYTLLSELSIVDLKLKDFLEYINYEAFYQALKPQNMSVRELKSVCDYFQKLLNYSSCDFKSPDDIHFQKLKYLITRLDTLEEIHEIIRKKDKKFNLRRIDYVICSCDLEIMRQLLESKDIAKLTILYIKALNVDIKNGFVHQKRSLIDRIKDVDNRSREEKKALIDVLCGYLSANKKEGLFQYFYKMTRCTDIADQIVEQLNKWYKSYILEGKIPKKVGIKTMAERLDSLPTQGEEDKRALQKLLLKTLPLDSRFLLQCYLNNGFNGAKSVDNDLKNLKNLNKKCLANFDFFNEKKNNPAFNQLAKEEEKEKVALLCLFSAYLSKSKQNCLKKYVNNEFLSEEEKRLAQQIIATLNSWYDIYLKTGLIWDLKGAKIPQKDIGREEDAFQIFVSSILDKFETYENQTLEEKKAILELLIKKLDVKDLAFILINYNSRKKELVFKDIIAKLLELYHSLPTILINRDVALQQLITTLQLTKTQDFIIDKMDIIKINLLIDNLQAIELKYRHKFGLTKEEYAEFTSHLTEAIFFSYPKIDLESLVEIFIQQVEADIALKEETICLN